MKLILFFICGLCLLGFIEVKAQLDFGQDATTDQVAALPDFSPELNSSELLASNIGNELSDPPPVPPDVDIDQSELLASNQEFSRTSQDTDPDNPEDPEPEPDEGGGLWDWIKMNIVSLLFGLIGFGEVIVRLTPTERDDAWLRWLRNIVDGLFPNRKSGGGTHTV